MCQGVVVRHQTISQVQSGLHDCSSFLTEQKGEARSTGDVAMHPHDRHEGSHLIPPRHELWSCCAEEPSDVTCDIWGSSENPVQHHARCSLKVLPSRSDVTCPDCGAHASHARSPAAIDRVETPGGIHQLQRVLLGNVPPVVGEDIRLTFVVPPKAHSFLEEVTGFLCIPSSGFRVGEVDIAAHCICILPLGWEDAAWFPMGEEPPLLSSVLQQVLVAKSWFPNASNLDILVMVIRKLLFRLWKGEDMVSEVLIVGPPCRLKVVIRHICEPSEVDDNRVDGVLTITEIANDLLHVGPVFPAPARGNETKSIPRWNRRGSCEVVGSLCAMKQRGGWHEKKLKVIRKPKVPSDGGPRR
mmetsp:Transcript_13549/g.29671  ORF Transcript_13549/g.29671 Transcript_13549/m.29671 type:complete len:356 (-) Transcript_13549:231-1298(-)